MAKPVRYFCGVPTKDGSPCKMPVGADGELCPNHAAMKNGGRRAGYDSLLPKYIADHYDESDETLLSLRPKVALLDSFLRKKLVQMGENGMADIAGMIKIVTAMHMTPHNDEMEELLTKLDVLLERAATETNLERDIRNLIQEIAQTTKQEVGHMVSLGQVVPIENVTQLVRELHVLASNYCVDDIARDRLTRDFHKVFVRNTNPSG